MSIKIALFLNRLSILFTHNNNLNKQGINSKGNIRLFPDTKWYKNSLDECKKCCYPRIYGNGRDKTDLMRWS